VFEGISEVFHHGYSKKGSKGRCSYLLRISGYPEPWSHPNELHRFREDACFDFQDRVERHRFPSLPTNSLRPKRMLTGSLSRLVITRRAQRKVKDVLNNTREAMPFVKSKPGAVLFL